MMLKIQLKILMLILAIPLLIFSSANNFVSDDTLLIGIIGDQTGTYDLDSTYRTLEMAVDKLSKMNPDIVLHVGDLVESINKIDTYADFQSNFDRAIDILDRLPTSWYMTVGDHDVVPPKFEPSSTDRTREQWFKNSCLVAGLPFQDDLYYSFDFKGYHFICLYSLENLHTDPRWGPIFLNKLSAKQIEWLQIDLDQHKTAKGIIVVVHHPHWYVWSNWSKIHVILRKYPVAAVIAGHYHYDQDEGVIDNIRYLVIGTTGGVVKNTDKHSGGTSQFATLKLINNNVIDIKLHEISSDSLLELSPRQSMDRIQAISCMLDNLYMDENLNRKDGYLFSFTDPEGFTKIRNIGLESLSNPIDIPITIEINTESDILKNSTESQIQLKPGERIGWSNYTNVGQWFKPSPLWVSELKQDPVLTDKQDGISIQIKVTFQDPKERWIKSTVYYPIKDINN